MPATDRPRARNEPRTVAFEIGCILFVALYYILGNQVFEVDADPTTPLPKEASPAHANAYKLWEFEKKIGIAWEKPAQEFFSQYPWTMWTFVMFYAGPHFVLTWGFLAWAYWYRFPSFAYVRNAMLIVTISAFTFEWWWPVAPPRLVTDFGMVDTVRNTLPVNNSTPWINALVNDYAGFPSVHTSWALMVSYFLIRFGKSPWRWLWVLYPAMIALSITATANHVTWDVVGALVWVGTCEVIHDWLARTGRLPSFAAPGQPKAAAVSEA